MHDIFFASGGISGRGDGRGRIDGPSETKVVNSPVLDNGGVHVVEAALCPLCGASGRVRYSQLRDRSWSAPGTWSFRECVACGHLWLDPCPVAEEIGRLYASYYTHGVERGSPLLGDGFWPKCRRGVLDPVTFLSVDRRALEPHGLMYVFTPNAESWGHAMFGASWYPLEPPRHLHIFRPRNLVACAERARLQVVEVRTTGRLHLFFDASVSIHKTGRYRFDDPTIQASIFDRLFRVAENLLVRLDPYAGEEIVMRCTKPAPD